jgi:hypothetical protein
LSQYIGVGWEKKTSISASNQRNQTISLVVDVMAWYYASMDDWETIDCFLLFQEIRESLKKIQNSVTDLRYVGSLPWSASEYTKKKRNFQAQKVFEGFKNLGSTSIIYQSLFLSLSL